MKRRGHSVFRAVSLVVRYILGELSETEKKEYAQLLEDTGLQEKNWNGEALQHELREDRRFDQQEAYRQFLLQVPRKSRMVRLRWLKVAALWVLPWVIGGIVWYAGQNSLPEKNQVVQIYPVSSKAFIEMADGKNVEVTALRDSLSEQDGTLIRQDSGKLVYTGKNNFGKNLIYNTLNVPRGGEYALCLSDGTKVWLNSDSRLKFPVQFIGDQREVFLSGEAYFEVAHNAVRPFVVNTSLGKIKVLGTAFNVQDYHNERQVVTTLVNGKVQYFDGSGKSCLLEPGFQVVDTRNGHELQIRKVNLEEYVGWKDGLYTFYNYTLEEIMRTVERNYDVLVSFAVERLKTLRFTGDLQKYDDVEKFLRFIEMGGDVVFVLEGKKIRIEPK